MSFRYCRRQRRALSRRFQNVRDQGSRGGLAVRPCDGDPRGISTAFAPCELDLADDGCARLRSILVKTENWICRGLPRKDRSAHRTPLAIEVDLGARLRRTPWRRQTDSLCSPAAIVRLETRVPRRSRQYWATARPLFPKPRINTSPSDANALGRRYTRCPLPFLFLQKREHRNAGDAPKAYRRRLRAPWLHDHRLNEPQNESQSQQGRPRLSRSE